MENNTYRVGVTSPGLTVFFRNRVNRTPVVFKNVYEGEVDVLELQFKQKSIKYTIEKNHDEEKIDEKVVEEVTKNEDVLIEELYPKEEKEPESILDKLIAEDE